MIFWIKYSDNELLSIYFHNQKSKTVVKCIIYSVSMESLCINKSVDFQLPLLVDSNYNKHCCLVSRIFSNEPLFLVLFQDSKLNLHCYQLDIENEIVNIIFSYNFNEKVQSINATDGPIISYTTYKYLYVMISDYSGYFKIYQYNNKNNVNEVIYIGKSLSDSVINQQLICKDDNNEYKVLDIDIFNVANPILESECDNLYKLLNEYKISSLLNESNHLIIMTSDSKVIIISQEDYDDRIVINCENVNYIKYYQPNLLCKGFIINSFEIIDIDFENQSQLLIPNEKMDNINDIIIISNCILYIMNDNSIYITDSFVVRQYNTVDNKMIKTINDGVVINKVLSSISLKYNEMVENILNNNEVENHKIDLINQIFNRDFSMNVNYINVKYNRSKLDCFIPSTVKLSNIENSYSLISNHQNMNDKKCELIDNIISIIYDNIIAIKLKINNCSKYELNNCEIMIISNGILYSTIYNVKQQTEHILPSQSIDVQIECNLNHSENILPSFMNIYFNNQYIEYLVSYNMSNIVFNNNDTSERVEIYNKTLLMWKKSVPKDLNSFTNIKITKMNEKCYKIQYNSNDSRFLLSIMKYMNSCTCDLYTLSENVDIDSCFDVLSSEINLLKNNNNDNKIEASLIKTSKIMNNLHKEICLECIEKLSRI